MESGAAAEPTATHFTYRLVHLGAGVADDVDALGQQVPGKETEEGREGLARLARHGAARRGTAQGGTDLLPGQVA